MKTLREIFRGSGFFSNSTWPIKNRHLLNRLIDFMGARFK